MDSRLKIDPNVCHGKPVVRGTRVLVSSILGALGAGDSIEDILEDYPNITKEDGKENGEPETSAKTSLHSLRRTRFPSSPGVRRRRRNRMVRGTHQVHAVSASRPIPALPVAQERHPDAVEQPCAGRPRDFPEGPPRAAENAMEPQG